MTDDGEKFSRQTKVEEARTALGNRIQEDVSAAHAKFAERLLQSPGSTPDATVWYLGTYFDINAYYHCALIRTSKGASGWYETYLGSLFGEVIAKAEKITARWPSIFAPDLAMQLLRAHLFGRRSYWQSEALKRAREFAANQGESLVPPEADVMPAGLAISDGRRSRQSLRVTPMIISRGAADKMERYIRDNGMGQTEFAIKAGTTDRTLRSFRKTGKVRRDIFIGIARAMEMSKEELLKQ